jgi:hypothetical protein
MVKYCNQTSKLVSRPPIPLSVIFLPFSCSPFQIFPHNVAGQYFLSGRGGGAFIQNLAQGLSGFS